MPTPAVGPVLMLGFDGLTLPARIKAWIREQRLGGVFYFGPNIHDRQQVEALSREAQSCVTDLPLFIALDQEGGRVQQWGLPHTSALPAARAVGEALARSGDAGAVRRLARDVGAEIASLGVNLDFAPVLDVNTNPANPIIGDRAFGSTAALVAQAGAAFVQGLHDAGVLACGKHFPGHGDTDLDSHLVLPIVAHGVERLNEVELAPFRAAISAGLRAMMTAHVLYPALDPRDPATLSAPILSLLRGGLGFDGVVFTDDMRMQGVRQGLDLVEASIRALLAGCDVVLSCTELDGQEALLAGLDEAMASGRIPLERVAASTERITSVKRRWLSRP